VEKVPEASLRKTELPKKPSKKKKGKEIVQEKSEIEILAVKGGQTRSNQDQARV